MRLINSDSQVDEVRADNGSAAVRIDLGGFVLLAAIAVMLVTVGFSVWAMKDAESTRIVSDARHEAQMREQDATRAELERYKTEARVTQSKYEDLKSRVISLERDHAH